MSRRIHGLFLPLVFPAGVAPGEGSDYNLLTIARNGEGLPVLRGTAVAGALRHAWKRHLQQATGLSEEAAEDTVKDVFGYALGDEDLVGVEEHVGSSVQVSDCVLDPGVGPLVRTHHLRNRHSGVVAHGGLFSLEACPPATTTTVVLWLREDGESDGEALDLLRTFAGLLENGMTLGGKTARGIGVARLNGTARYQTYELTDAQGYGRWLDDHRAWRSSGQVPAGQPLESAPRSDTSWLQVRFSLGIPRGQDLLVGDGQGLDHEMEPQRVRAADGKEYWRLPGASLRGIFRGWFARLAARADRPVADQAERQVRVWRGKLTLPEHERLPKHENYTGENVGNCFLPESQRQPLTPRQRRSGARKTECPVAGLFGSLFEAGRIHFSDAYAPCSESRGNGNGHPEEQLRMHVAVDRVTGGAAESMLFDNTVLTAHADGRSPRFEVTLLVDQPTADEARWLAETLKALDLGVLRVGSSKSSGRLSLVEPPRAKGPCEEVFQAIQPEYGPEMFAVQ